MQQLPVGQRDGGLRGERLGQTLIRLGKRNDDIVLRHPGIDQLQHADDLALVVAHRHGEERLRAVTGALVELARSGKIEAPGDIGVGDVLVLPVIAAWAATMVSLGEPSSR